MESRKRNEEELVGGQNRRDDSAASDAVTWDVVSRVARAEAVDPVELPPLGEVVDPEALERVVQHPSSVEHVRFEYCGQTVEVKPAGAGSRVEITDDQ